MTNSIGPRAGSLLGNAGSLLGSAGSLLGNAGSLLGSTKEAFKAIAEAAVNTPAGSAAATSENIARKGRRGTLLDRYA